MQLYEFEDRKGQGRTWLEIGSRYKKPTPHNGDDLLISIGHNYNPPRTVVMDKAEVANLYAKLGEWLKNGWPAE